MPFSPEVKPQQESQASLPMLSLGKKALGGHDGVQMSCVPNADALPVPSFGQKGDQSTPALRPTRC